MFVNKIARARARGLSVVVNTFRFRLEIEFRFNGQPCLGIDTSTTIRSRNKSCKTCVHLSQPHVLSFLRLLNTQQDHVVWGFKKCILRFVFVINLVKLAAIFLNPMFYHFFVAMDVDVEIAVKFQYALKYLGLFFNRWQ